MQEHARVSDSTSARHTVTEISAASGSNNRPCLSRCCSVLSKSTDRSASDPRSSPESIQWRWLLKVHACGIESTVSTLDDGVSHMTIDRVASNGREARTFPLQRQALDPERAAFLRQSCEAIQSSSSHVTAISIDVTVNSTNPGVRIAWCT